MFLCWHFLVVNRDANILQMLVIFVFQPTNLTDSLWGPCPTSHCLPSRPFSSLIMVSGAFLKSPSSIHKDICTCLSSTFDVSASCEAFVGLSVASVRRSLTWRPICQSSSIPALADFRTIDLSSPVTFVGSLQSYIECIGLFLQLDYNTFLEFNWKQLQITFFLTL